MYGFSVVSNGGTHCSSLCSIIYLSFCFHRVAKSVQHPNTNNIGRTDQLWVIFNTYIQRIWHFRNANTYLSLATNATKLYALHWKHNIDTLTFQSICSRGHSIENGSQIGLILYSDCEFMPNFHLMEYKGQTLHRGNRSSKRGAAQMKNGSYVFIWIFDRKSIYW